MKGLKLGMSVVLSMALITGVTGIMYTSSDAFAADGAKSLEPSASRVSTEGRSTVPRGAFVDDLTKEPSQQQRNCESELQPAAVKIPSPAKNLFPAGAVYYKLIPASKDGISPNSLSCPSDYCNLTSGDYHGSVSNLGGQLYTNDYFSTGSNGKLMVTTKFEPDTATGYSYTINCYDRTDGNRLAASWTGETGTEGHPGRNSISFYNLNKSHFYFFGFQNNSSYGKINGDLSVGFQD